MSAPDYIRASNGEGEAVRAIIVENRDIGDMSIITDSVLNWPHTFIATSGTLDVSTDLVDPDTVTIFKAHLDGSIIMIDEFAPGYNDIGNTTDQVVLLKPTTTWADAVSEALEKAGGITVSPTPPVTPDDGDFWLDESAAPMPMAAIAAAVGGYLYPVGSIYTNANDATNPATLLGFGTWVAFAEGRVPVGKSASGTFQTAGATGGEENHVLTYNEMPVHAHGTPTYDTPAGGSYGLAAGGGAQRGVTSGTYNAGSGWAHNNLQPYVVVYMWQRTA